MSLLEIIGLDYILGGGEGISIFSVIIIFIGIPAWILLSILDGVYMDLAATTWNLVPAIILLAILFFRTINSIVKHENSGKIIFNIISSIIVIVFFVYGLTHIYHSLIFPFEYYPIWSGVAWTLYPSVAYLILYGMLFLGTGVLDKIKVIPKVLEIMIIAFLWITLLGQSISIIFHIVGHKEIYNRFAYYHNLEYEDARKKYEGKSIEEILNEEYKFVYDYYQEYFKEELGDLNLDAETYEYRCNAIKNGIVNDISKLNDTTNDIGYKITGNYQIGDTKEDVIKVKDREWNDQYSYYILDKTTYKVKTTTKEYYEEIKSQNK